MKVKLINAPYRKCTLEKEINKFIQDKKVIDIKFTEAQRAADHTMEGGWSALVMYEELTTTNSGCDWCKKRKALFDHSMPIRGMVNAYLSTNLTIFGNSIVVATDSYDEGGFSTGTRIKFCPMCGTKLSK